MVVGGGSHEVRHCYGEGACMQCVDTISYDDGVQGMRSWMSIESIESIQDHPISIRAPFSNCGIAGRSLLLHCSILLHPRSLLIVEKLGCEFLHGKVRVVVPSFCWFGRWDGAGMGCGKWDMAAVLLV